MTLPPWLDEAVEIAQEIGRGTRAPAELAWEVTPERFLALAEVVKAAEQLAGWPHSRKRADILDEALARLEELGRDA